MKKMSIEKKVEVEEVRGEIGTESGVASTGATELQGSEMEGNWVPSELEVQRKDG